VLFWPPRHAMQLGVEQQEAIYASHRLIEDCLRVGHDTDSAPCCRAARASRAFGSPPGSYTRAMENWLSIRCTSRKELGLFWLPWCVDQARPREIIRIADEPHRAAEARQLRIVDLTNAETRAALTAQARTGGGTSLPFIEQVASTYARAAQFGSLVHPGAQAIWLPEGPMLREGCHRVCALFESGADNFETVIEVGPPFDSWLVYAQHPSLRALG
jgi:hypothetical protein